MHDERSWRACHGSKHVDCSVQREFRASDELLRFLGAKKVDINTLDVVALLEDVPERGLVRGQVGTVVEKLAPGIFEVEFSDNDGRTYASRTGRKPSGFTPRIYRSRLVIQLGWGSLTPPRTFTG
jgi:Domain of unknown function (DUF4926)